MRSVLTSALLWLVVKLSDHGSRPMEQEEKENNNLEASRKRLGQDTDGNRSYFNNLFIFNLKNIHLASSKRSLVLFCLSFFPALSKGEENSSKQGTSRKKCRLRARMKISFIYLCFMLIGFV